MCRPPATLGPTSGHASDHRRSDRRCPTTDARPREPSPAPVRSRNRRACAQRDVSPDRRTRSRVSRSHCSRQPANIRAPSARCETPNGHPRFGRSAPSADEGRHTRATRDERLHHRASTPAIGSAHPRRSKWLLPPAAPHGGRSRGSQRCRIGESSFPVRQPTAHAARRSHRPCRSG